MNSRLLCRIWQLRSCHLLRKVSYRIQQGYVIPVVPCPCTPASEVSKKYSTNVSLKEKNNSVDQAYNKLHLDYKHHGNVHPSNFGKVLVSLEAGQAVTNEQSIFLLNACGELMPSQSPESRMKLFQRMWDHLKSRGTLTKQHYIVYLKVHATNHIAVSDFRKFINESGLTKDHEVYEKLVELACEMGDMKTTTEILGVMKENGFALTEDVFNSLILGQSRNNNLKEALSVLETMSAAGVAPSNNTYTQLIVANIENGETRRATEILEQHSAQLIPVQILKIIRALTNTAGKDNQSVMEVLIKQLPADLRTGREIPPLIRNLCSALIHEGRIDQAYSVIAAFPTPKLNENQDTDTFGVAFLQDLFRNKVNPNKIVEIAKNLMESGKNPRGLHVACDSAMHRNPVQAVPYLKALSEIEPLRPHYFWPLLLHSFRYHGEAGLLKSLKTMSTLGVACDYETLAFYVLPRLSLTLQNPQQAIKTLEDCGLKTSQILTPFIAHLIFQQKLTDVSKIAQLYISKLDTNKFVRPLANLISTIRANKLYQPFCNVIHMLHKKSDDPKSDFAGQVILEIIGHARHRHDGFMLTRIITDLNKLGTQMSPAAVEILSGHLGTLKTDKTDIDGLRKMLSGMKSRTLSLPNSDGTGAHITHPRDMSYDELECHLVELEAKGMNTRGVLRRLLQVCVRDNQLERALVIKRKCEDTGVVISPGMLASIFELYIKLENFPAAEATYEKLLTGFPGFFLDEHKLIDYAALMVRHNKFDDALKLLSDRAASRKIFGGEYVIKNVWNFLTNVAQFAAKRSDLPADKNLTKELFFFLKKHGYCKSHNAILGPIIREYLYRKDIRAAVAEVKTLADTFRHTPLQFELTSLLVHLSNTDEPNEFNIAKEEAKVLLEQLTAVIASVHGSVNMNSSLLLAVAEAGTTNQLRKLLINPDFRINRDMLLQNCEHLNKEGSIETLMNLAKACRGLGHAIKEQDVYTMLLSKFISDNNCEASLALYEKLEADDELNISSEFLKNLVNLLKINKIDIPSNLALRAQVM